MGFLHFIRLIEGAARFLINRPGEWSTWYGIESSGVNRSVFFWVGINRQSSTF